MKKKKKKVKGVLRVLAARDLAGEGRERHLF
jgi:hypothetical protein